MDLEQHLRLHAGELLINADHRELDQIRRRALQGRVDGGDVHQPDHRARQPGFSLWF